MADNQSNIVEEWRSVPGYEGLYSASKTGKIRGERDNHQQPKQRILKPAKTKGGYLTVSLCKEQRKRTTRVHQVIMLTFIGRRAQNLTVNHKNGIKTDNRLENLEYMTQLQNTHHAMHMGLLPSGDRSSWRKHPELVLRGSSNPLSKLTDEKVKSIRRLIKTGTLQTVIAKMHGVSATVITNIKKGKSWRHVE